MKHSILHHRQPLPIAVLTLCLLTVAANVRAAQDLVLEHQIVLPGVAGRIDHMAVDLRRNRLFVAEIGNNSLDVVDLTAGKRVGQIRDLAEPQGVGYAPSADVLAVANGGDGSVRFYRGAQLAPAGTVMLGSDADDIRIDPRTGDIIVGYGSGGLAIIDPATRSKIGGVRLGVHPEGFAIDAAGRAFVNVPNAGQIALVDLLSKRQTTAWKLPELRANFPIALDNADKTLATVFRRPPTLALIDTRTGAPIARLETCDDADDLFFDARRGRIYISCGAGFIDVFEREGRASYSRLSRVKTSIGARTSLFVPELNRLFVAAPASKPSEAAAIKVFQPLP